MSLKIENSRRANRARSVWALKGVYLAGPRRMRSCLKRIQPMPNVLLAYVSVYQRMSDIFHPLAYASTICNSVTGPLGE